MKNLGLNKDISLVTTKNQTTCQNKNVGLNVGLDVGLNKTEKKVIEFLIENPSLTSTELAEQIGVTKRTIERTFKTLQEKKIIERIGSKRYGNWIVIR